MSFGDRHQIKENRCHCAGCRRAECYVPQRLLFSSAPAGDLTKFLSGYFDTTTGPKNDPASYTAIAKAFAIPAPDILFMSDVTRELDAARSAGMQTRLCMRPGNHPQPPHDHEITSFDALV